MMIALGTVLILASNLYRALAFVPPSVAVYVPARWSWQQHQSAVISSDVTNDASSLNPPVNDEEEDSSSTATSTSPGLRENEIFDCDSSVEFWREFGNQNNPRTLQSNIADIAAIASRFATQGPDALRYWLRHTGRSSYFAGNALLGNLGYQLHERLVKRNDERSSTTASSNGSVLPFGMDNSVASRLLLEAYLCYEHDYDLITEGKYAEPWDMKSFRHRQSNPANVLRQTNRFVNEAIGTLGRRYRQNDEDKNIWITDSASPKLYPDYYRTAFHYQTDGWMSKRSADVYETSTETLFLGRQDAMQRTSLPPIVKYAKEKVSNEEPLKILEVACGTGRFMTFIRDNLPLNAECTAVDLSPYYLDAARDNDAYWRKYRREEESRKGNVMSKDVIQPLRLVQAQAEDLPFQDESFDIVVCVYLYHELPQEIRSKVSAEMARVLKQNGLLVFTDSIQRGDRPMLDNNLAQFENMNEPFYVNYCGDNLPDHFLKEGLTPLTKSVRSTTKSLSFLKA